MASKIVVNLDTSKEFYESYKCKQNDDLTLEANIFENGATKDVTNCSIVVQAKKADNTYVIQNTDITKDKNKFISNLVRDFTRVPGETKIEVVLTESSKQNTTFSFCIEVVGSVIKGAEESKDLITSLEVMQDAVVEIGKISEETKELIKNSGAASKEEMNKVNAQLADIKYISYITALDLELFPRFSNENDDYQRVLRVLSYCKTNNIRNLRINKDIDIASNTITIDIKFFSIFGTTINDKKISINGTGEKILSIAEQGFSMDNININGDLNENGDWDLSKTTGISYDYTKQDVDSKLYNVTISRCNRAIDMTGRNLHTVDLHLILCNYGIRFRKNITDLSNPNGIAIRGIRLNNTICHTMGKTGVNKGKIIIEVPDITNSQDIVIENITIEQGCKQFYNGYITGCKIRGVKVYNCYGKGAFIEILERPSEIFQAESCIEGDFIFNSSTFDLTENDICDNVIKAKLLDKCNVKINSKNTRKEAILIDIANECTIDNCTIYNVGYREDLDGKNIYSAIKINQNIINSTIVRNYINSRQMKHGIEVVGKNIGSYIEYNRIFYANSTQISYMGSNSSDFESSVSGVVSINRRNDSNIVANGLIGMYNMTSINDGVVYNVGNFRFVFNGGEKGKENTSIQVFTKTNGVDKRVCAFTPQGIIIEGDRFLSLQGNFLWFDSQKRLRTAPGMPSNLDSEGIIIGTQS